MDIGDRRNAAGTLIHGVGIDGLHGLIRRGAMTAQIGELPGLSSDVLQMTPTPTAASPFAGDGIGPSARATPHTSIAAAAAQKIRILASRMLFRSIVCRINVPAREPVLSHARARTQL